MVLKKAVKKVVKKTTARKKVVRKVKPKITTIVVKYDCGYGNHLTLRGEGGALSWHHGLPLINKSAGEWLIELDAGRQLLEFKVLINDQVFELGENHKVKLGETFEYAPKFH